MPSLLAKRWSHRRFSTGRSRLARQDGFLLVEVIISALLVGVIVVATLTGFDVVGRTSADQRFHNQAALLAAQSQEQLRTEPGSVLEALETNPHVYTAKVAGTTYTVTQSAEPLKGSVQAAACTTTEQNSTAAPNIRITSSVTWPALSSARSAVKQSSVITPPTGSSLEVKFATSQAVTAGVSGLTAVIRYTPTESTGTVTRQATSGASGCVIFGSIRATSVILEIPEKANFVTTTGTLKVPTTEVTIAPNITTPHTVIYNDGGAIQAKFTYEGKTEAKGKKVAGDTFVAYFKSSETSQLYIGSPLFSYETGGEEHYAALTGGTLVGGVPVSYAPPSTAKTAAGAKYLHGDLFPFPSEWAVYAGDCGENNASSLTSEAVKNGKGTVLPGTTTVVEVPMSYVNLNVWTGYSSAHKGSLTAEPLKVKVTNSECAGAAVPSNASGTTYIHYQSLLAGQLEDPFQPFGKFSLCVAGPNNHTYTPLSYTNNTVAGSSRDVYLGQRSVAERTTQKNEEAAAKVARQAEEAAAKPAKEKREKEEKEAATAKTAREKAETEATTAKTKREKEETEATTAKTGREKAETEMTAARIAREKKEKEEREKWLAEEASKKITKAQRTTKETEQTTARKAKEKEETTAKTKRATEEATAKTAQEKRATEEAAAKVAKEKRATEEAAAKVAKEKRVKEEAEAGPAKVLREKAETEATAAEAKRVAEEGEEATNKVTVESNRPEC